MHPKVRQVRSRQLQPLLVQPTSRQRQRPRRHARSRRRCQPWQEEEGLSLRGRRY